MDMNKYIIKQLEGKIAELEKELRKYKKNRRANLPDGIEAQFTDKAVALNYLNLGIKHMCFAPICIKRKKRGEADYIDTITCVNNQDMTDEQYELYKKVFSEVAAVLAKYEYKVG